MADLERQDHDHGEEDISIQVARAMLGRRKGISLSENDQFLLSYYGPGGFMDEPENSEFRSKVMSEFERLTSPQENKSTVNEVLYPYGRRIPLYSDEELKKAKRHRRIKKGRFEIKPIPFWNDPGNNSTPVKQVEDEVDIEKEIFKFGKNIDSRFGKYSDNLLQEERRNVRRRKKELRDYIDLPVVKRGGDFVNDKFYNFLVKYVVRWDIFRIFDEYLNSTVDIREHPNEKVQTIKFVIDSLLNPQSEDYKNYQSFDSFVDSVAESWSIDIDQYNILRRRQSFRI